MMLMLQMQRQRAGQSLEGGILAYQAVRWPGGVVQRRTVALEFECPEGTTAIVKEAPEGECRVTRVGRCRRDAVKAGSRKLSRLVQVFEATHGGEQRWFHEALVTVPDGSTLATLLQQSSAPSPPRSAPDQTPPGSGSGSTGSLVLSPPTAAAPAAFALEPPPSLSPALSPEQKRRRISTSEGPFEAAARLGAGLCTGQGTPYSLTLLLVLHVHELFPSDHKEVVARLEESDQSGNVEEFAEYAERRLRELYAPDEAALLVAMLRYGRAHGDLTRALRAQRAGEPLEIARRALVLSLALAEAAPALPGPYCARVREVLRAWERGIDSAVASAASAEDLDLLFAKMGAGSAPAEQI